MKALIFQHTVEEGVGSLGQWLESVKIPFHTHHLYKEASLPDPRGYDWLIILGGPMNVDEEGKHPWLKPEKRFLKDWLAADKPVLGICLGGQLLAQALGGKVTKSQVREIGFHSVSRTGVKHPALRRWPDLAPVFQWHEDQFTLPEGCASLLTSEACEHQAFALNRKTVGLQFHPESVEGWILECYNNFQPEAGEKYVQSKEQCLAIMPTLLPAMTKLFFSFLSDFVENARI